MNHLCLVTGLQVPENRGIIEEGEVHHILHLLKFGRIDPANLGALVGELFMANSYHTLGGRIIKLPRL